MREQGKNEKERERERREEREEKRGRLTVMTAPNSASFVVGSVLI